MARRVQLGEHRTQGGGASVCVCVARSPFREKVLEVDHFHHDGDVLLGGGAEVVFEVALPLQLEHHLLDGHALPADAAELVPESVGHTLQRIFDEGLSLSTATHTHTHT